MTKPIIIYGNIQKKSIQKLYSELRKLYGSPECTATVIAIPQKHKRVKLQQQHKEESVKACFIYYLQTELFTPRFFDSLQSNDASAYQYFIATVHKPFLDEEQLTRAQFFKLPTLHNEIYLQKLAKLIWVQLQLNALPNSILLKDAQLLKDYYQKRLAHYREKLISAQEHHLKNIEVKDAKVVA